MRPHGRANIDSHRPAALAICDRCQEMVNHHVLRWQMQWRGPMLQNIRLLVCPECYDTPQEQLRTFVLPMDPVTIQNARSENYAEADNPASYLGYDPADAFRNPSAQLGDNIGNMTLNGGVNAAFDANKAKRYPFSAGLANSNSSFNNWVGKNWGAQPSGVLLTQPSTVAVLDHVVSSFVLYAPSDRPFLNSATGITGFRLEGSNDGATWSTIYSSSTVGGSAETITAVTTAPTPYPYHRINIQGDGISAVSLAQAVLNISDAGQNEI